MQVAPLGTSKKLPKFILPPERSFQFVRKTKSIDAQESVSVAAVATRSVEENIDHTTHVGVADGDRRTFLKALGILGLGIAGASMIPDKANALVMGGSPATSVVGVKNSSNTRIDPATDTTLSGVKTQTDKLTFDGSSNLYVQAATNFSSQLENASSVVINPATEDSLSAVKTQLNKLTFDGSNNLMTTGSGGSASVVGVKDTTNTQVNPATDDSIVYLRRIVKLMESQAVVDSANRQRVTIDSITGSLTLTTLTGITNALPAGTNLMGGVTIDGQGRQQFTEIARQAYNSGIRSNLIFS